MERFHTSFNGYKKEEVNKFVNDVVAEVENIVNKSKEKDELIKQMQEQLSRYQNMENTLNRVVLVAEEASHQIKKMARNEGNAIVEEAKQNASKIINEALIRAEETQKEVVILKRNVAIFKRKMRGIIESQLDLVDEMDTVELQD